MLACVVGVVTLWCIVATILPEDTKKRRTLFAVATRTTAAAMWPSFLMSLLQPEDRDAGLLWLPLAWNVVVYAVDLVLLCSCEAADGHSLPALKLDTSGVTGLGFGLCSLLGSRADSKYGYLFLYAIFGCFLLVFPSHNLPPDCPAAHVFDSVQRSALTWCTGVLVAAVVLTRRFPTTAAPPSATAR